MKSVMHIIQEITGDGCPADTDSIWNIEWPPSPNGTLVTQSCPGGANTEGIYNNN